MIRSSQTNCVYAVSYGLDNLLGNVPRAKHSPCTNKFSNEYSPHRSRAIFWWGIVFSTRPGFVVKPAIVHARRCHRSAQSSVGTILRERRDRLDHAVAANQSQSAFCVASHLRWNKTGSHCTCRSHRCNALVHRARAFDRRGGVTVIGHSFALARM